LTITSIVICGVGVLLTFSPVAAWFGFVALPGLYWPFLVAILSCYLLLTQFVKSRMIRRFGVL
jgi:Mg2+-importing ATPase